MREQSLWLPRMASSSVGANQAERDSTSPAAIYFEMGMKTSNELLWSDGAVVFPVLTMLCPEQHSQVRSSNNEMVVRFIADANIANFLSISLYLQI